MIGVSYARTREEARDEILKMIEAEYNEVAARKTTKLNKVANTAVKYELACLKEDLKSIQYHTVKHRNGA